MESDIKYLDEVEILWRGRRVSYRVECGGVRRPYSLAVSNNGGYVYTAGVVPVYCDEEMGRNLIVEGGLSDKVEYVLNVILEIIRRVGRFENISDVKRSVLKTNVYLDELTQETYSEVNKGYRRVFGDDGPFPARTVVKADPPLGIGVEIEAVAYISR